MNKFLTLVLLSALIVPKAYAQRIVSDPAVEANTISIIKELGSLSQQITELKLQNEERNQKLQHSNSIAERNAQSVGKKLSLSIPIPSIDGIVNILKGGTQCLIPDWETLLPGIEVKGEVNILSLCDLKDAFETTMFLQPDAQNIALQQEYVLARRINILAKQSVDGLAVGLSGEGKAKEFREALDELSSEANGAENMNQRLSVLIEAQLLNGRINTELYSVVSKQLALLSSDNLQELPLQTSAFNEEEDN